MLGEKADSAGREAAGKYYRLDRAVKQLSDHIAFSDRLTNLTGQDLHISVRHMIQTSGLSGAEVYLRGQKSRIMEGYEKGGDNPTVFLRLGEDGLGIVAEDDALRVQYAQVATRQPAEAGLADNYLMLEPRATYELRWSIYPVLKGDYFDFVNAIRRNWGTNFTIPGAFAFAPHPAHEAEVPDLKGWLQNGALQVVSLQIPMPRPAVLVRCCTVRTSAWAAWTTGNPTRAEASSLGRRGVGSARGSCPRRKTTRTLSWPATCPSRLALPSWCAGRHASCPVASRCTCAWTSATPRARPGGRKPGRIRRARGRTTCGM